VNPALLQVMKGCKPGSRTASHAENHDVANMLSVSQSCDCLSAIGSADHG
jgi:hypothetical protein